MCAFRDAEFACILLLIVTAELGLWSMRKEKLEALTGEDRLLRARGWCGISICLLRGGQAGLLY